jgi:uncharacterized protein YndB with AHSA1/START domain
MMVEIEKPEAEIEVFTLTRRFKAPPELMWKLWTERQHLEQWWGPAGMKLVIKSIDLRPGGTMLYGMQSPFGHVHWAKFVYRLVEPPHRLVYAVSFTDDQGNPLRNPMNPLWPLEMLTDQSFNPVDGGTELHSRSYAINATLEERHVFLLGHAGLQITFAGTLSQLDNYLAKVEA